jgi:hypothetical protein
MLAQIADRTQSALRRREQHGRVPAHDQNGLAARRHCDIAAHDREIEWPSSSAREDSAKFSPATNLRRMLSRFSAKSSAAAAMIAWSSLSRGIAMRKTVRRPRRRRSPPSPR